MDLKSALEIYMNKYPSYKVGTILHIGDEWVVSARDKETDLELDISPVSINKNTGDIKVFFPPMNIEKMANATIVNVE